VRLTANIIGASHWLQFEFDGGGRFDEVLACVDAGPSSHRLFSTPIGEIQDSVLMDLPGNVAYCFDARLADFDVAQQQLLDLDARIADSQAPATGAAEAIGLRFEFPQAGESNENASADLRPKTLVWAELGESRRSIYVESAHCYPNEGCVVFSKTRVTPREEAR
jgi:hypothetical protein